MTQRGKRKKTVAAAKVKGLPKKLPTKGPVVSSARVQLYLRSGFNPLRYLTPELLGWYINRFRIGYPREISIAWAEIAERDDVVALVKPLREKAISRYDYQIEPTENLDESQLDEAAAQQEKIEYFFSNITATSTIDTDHVGGETLMKRQMMSAVGSRYSIHEIVWQPQEDGNLTAELRWTPLWFFERTLGRLRYLQQEGETQGIDLDEGGWMITVGEGLMIATMIAHTLKKMPLLDWATFCERNGMPAFIGTTDSPKGSQTWTALEEALRYLASDLAAIKSSMDKIDVVDLKGSQAALPYEPLVKRMDARIAALWRGGDLSTQSSGAHAQGRGSNRQEDEAEIILDDDVKMIEDTINRRLVRPACQYLFGTLPLVRYRVVIPPKEATAQDLAVDQFLLSAGAQLSVEDAMRRYGRVAAKPGETLLTPPQQDEQIPPGLGNERLSSYQMQHIRLIGAVRQRLLPLQAAALKPLDQRIAKILADPESDLENEVRRVIDDLPSVLKAVETDPSTATLLSAAYTAAYLDGLTQPTGLNA